MEKRKKTRRKYILDSSFQFKFIFVIFLLLLCTAVLTGAVMSYFYLFVFTSGEISCQHNYAVFLQWTILVVSLSVVFMVWGVSYTQSIIGPVFKTRALLRNAAMGMIPGEKIRFRKNDKFKDLADDLTRCFDIMRKYRDASVEPNPDKL